MTAKYTVTMYCPEDGKHIAANMRDMDVFECRAAGLEPLEAINDGVEKSSQVWTFCYGNLPLCVFGAVPDSVGGAVFWLLGTKDIRHHKRAFMMASKKYRDIYLNRYRYLTNVVCMENHESVRWLKWLGAEFQDDTAIIMGKPFQRFYLERSDG